MEKVTGIGGVFIKAKDPKALAEWYDKYLGVPFGKGLFVNYDWQNPVDPSGSTVFSLFKESSDYFEPSKSNVMLNFRVKNLDALLSELKEAGIWVAEKTEDGYGKFGWTMDPEGNKIELWEPVEEK